MPVKKLVTKNVIASKAKQSRSVKIPKKIATSSFDRLRTPRNDKLSIPVFSLLGRASGTFVLPKEIFGAKINENLLSQAVRVYSFNRSVHPGSTKTRGQVRGSTAKIWAQKGTGRARHGARTAPIFVGGGITFAPTRRKTILELPKKMKKAALLSALSSKFKDQEIIGLSGIEKASGKTKEIVKLLQKINVKSALIVTGEKQDNVLRASRNIPGISHMLVSQLNAYELIKHKMLLIEKDAIIKLTKGEKV